MFTLNSSHPPATTISLFALPSPSVSVSSRTRPFVATNTPSPSLYPGGGLGVEVRPDLLRLVGRQGAAVDEHLRHVPPAEPLDLLRAAAERVVPRADGDLVEADRLAVPRPFAGGDAVHGEADRLRVR